MAIRRLFKVADDNKSGKISEDEFVLFLSQKLNFVGYEDDVRALFKRYDVDKSKNLDVKYDSYCKLTMSENLDKCFSRVQVAKPSLLSVELGKSLPREREEPPLSSRWDDNSEYIYIAANEKDC